MPLETNELFNIIPPMWLLTMDDEKTWDNRDAVLQKHAENIMDLACKQRGNLNKKVTFT